MSDTLLLDPVVLLTKDLKQAASTLTHTEARYLVDTFYQLQRQRIRASNQIRSVVQFDDDEEEIPVLVDEDTGVPATEPHRVLRWLAGNAYTLEGNVKRALETYAKSHTVGQWALSICGVGPIISAGLMAHIDITRAPTVGHIWRFAGLDPTVTWEKKSKRPWNAALKVVCWKLGESFVKVHKRKDDFYGKLYLQRKEYETARNDRGELKDQAAKFLATGRFKKDTEAYKAYVQEKLPLGHLHARAKRWTVKLFLAHWHQVAYRAHYGTMPPKPYVLDILKHGHEIQCPNWPF